MIGSLCGISEDILDHDTAVIFAIDSGFRIIYCNEAWDRFALENGGPHLVRSGQVGRALADVVAEPLQRFYWDAFDAVLTTGKPWDHCYECSSADVYRKFHMRLIPFPARGGLLVVNSLVQEHPHSGLGQEAPSIELYTSQEGLVTMCAHCRRTRRLGDPSIWDFVPGFVANMPPKVSHGLCLLCWAYHYPGAGASAIG